VVGELRHIPRRSWFENLTTIGLCLTIHPEQPVEGFFEFKRETTFMVHY
jgi:hypothetical protein